MHCHPHRIICLCNHPPSLIPTFPPCSPCSASALESAQVMAAKELFTLDAMPPVSVLDAGAAVDLQAILHTATMRGTVGTSISSAAGAASRA